MPSFHIFVAEIFEPLGEIRIRKMFGGAGVYSRQDLFALIVDEEIYLKTDSQLSAELVNAGGIPFSWTNPKTGSTLTMSYVSLPVDAAEDRDAALMWAKQALDISKAVRLAKSKSPRNKAF